MSDPNFPLSLQGVERTFVQGDRRLQVLQGVTLDLRAGEIVALVGQSGSGKSTMLHVAGLLEKPDGGDIVVDGRPAGAQSDRQRTALRRKFLGFVYQYHHLLPEFSALENVMLPQMLEGLSRRQARLRALDLLAMVQLSDRADHRPVAGQHDFARCRRRRSRFRDVDAGQGRARRSAAGHRRGYRAVAGRGCLSGLA